MRILVADDEECLRDALEMTLTRRGHEVVLAKDGVEALRTYTELGPFDALITDYQMPGKNGVVLIMEVRAINPAQKCILVSGDPPQLSAAVREDAGEFPVLRKPYRQSELIAELIALLK